MLGVVQSRQGVVHVMLSSCKHKTIMSFHRGCQAKCNCPALDGQAKSNSGIERGQCNVACKIDTWLYQMKRRRCPQLERGTGLLLKKQRSWSGVVEIAHGIFLAHRLTLMDSQGYAIMRDVSHDGGPLALAYIH